MRRSLFLLVLVLLPAALLLHLGIMVFIDDEAIRSLVALEMQWSGNYVAPTLHGDAYLNKPPGWNWILTLSFWLHGGPSEWAARLPTVIGLVGFAATTYYFSRRHFSRYLAAIHALTVITCGRMLFWDSMLALIDVTFSWVVYAQIMLLYEHGRHGRWWKAFGWSYALTAVAFLLKGLPALVFQGLTVLAVLGWTQSWRQFFRPAHLLCGLACVGALALYYWQYGHYVDLTKVAERLFVESGKRTAVAHGWWPSVRHAVTFPFEMAYHFLPWTFLLVYLLWPGARQRLRDNDFAAFSLVAFLVNLPIYWLSPNVYPRYLLMLFPLLFGAGLFLHQEAKRENALSYRILRLVLLGLMTLLAVLLPFVPLVPDAAVVDHAWWKSIMVGGAAGAVVVLAWQRRRRGEFLLLFVIFLLVLRIGFNLFILPARAAGNERGNAVRETAYSLADGHRQDSLAIYGYTLIEPATGYYLSVGRGYVVPRRWENFDSTTVYVLSPIQYPGVVSSLKPTDSLYLRHGRRYYPVGTFPTPPTGRAPLNGVRRDGMGNGL